jgi:hypothetical protein
MLCGRFLCLVLVGLALGQPTAVAQEPPARFEIVALFTEDSVVRVKYYVPFEGYLEMRLYDHLNRIVGRNHFVDNVGEHETQVHRSRMHLGETYRIAFIYKGQLYDKEFVNEY